MNSCILTQSNVFWNLTNHIISKPRPLNSGPRPLYSPNFMSGPEAIHHTLTHRSHWRNWIAAQTDPPTRSINSIVSWLKQNCDTPFHPINHNTEYVHLWPMNLHIWSKAIYIWYEQKQNKGQIWISYQTTNQPTKTLTCPDPLQTLNQYKKSKQYVLI